MGFIWIFFGKASVYVLVFTLVPVSWFAVGSGRGDGAANFAELDSDFSEPGKLVWTFDMADVLHVHVKVCAWHVSVGKYPVACKATTRMFQSRDDLWWEMA